MMLLKFLALNQLLIGLSAAVHQITKRDRMFFNMGRNFLIIFVLFTIGTMTKIVQSLIINENSADGGLGI